MKDPVRLLTGGSSEAQDLLRSAAGDEPLRLQLDQLGARLAPVVAAPASGGLLAWVLAGSALVGGAGAIVLARDHHEQAPATARVVDTPAAPQPAPPPAAPIEPAPPAAAPTQQEPPHAAEPRTVEAKITRTEPAHQTPATPARQTPPPPIPRELELLTPAQAALHAGDFQRALALAERHAGLYASGMFAEEREAIAIEALSRLGQHDRARVRFTAFTTLYPHSGYRARLERTVRE
jgi:hypothetical protein